MDHYGSQDKKMFYKKQPNYQTYRNVWTRDYLIEQLKERNIRGYSNKKKEELVNMLIDSDLKRKMAEEKPEAVQPKPKFKIPIGKKEIKPVIEQVAEIVKPKYKIPIAKKLKIEVPKEQEDQLSEYAKYVQESSKRFNDMMQEVYDKKKREENKRNEIADKVIMVVNKAKELRPNEKTGRFKGKADIFKKLDALWVEYRKNNGGIDAFRWNVPWWLEWSPNRNDPNAESHASQMYRRYGINID